MEEAISDAAGLFIEYDRHPNEKWHQKAAEEIERFLRASKAFQEDSLAYGKYPSGTSNTKAP
jgi:hypothetical protein